MKHVCVSRALAAGVAGVVLSLGGCSRGEKAAPVVVESGATQEQHREVERRAAAKVVDSINLDSAFRAYARGDYPGALAKFKALAAKGDARAAYYAGVMHSNGEGVKRDLAESAKWYNQAADAGNPDGMYALARLYVIGSGVPRDVEKALELYDRAAQTYPPGEDRERAIEQRLAVEAALEEIKSAAAEKTD